MTTANAQTGTSIELLLDVNVSRRLSLLVTLTTSIAVISGENACVPLFLIVIRQSRIPIAHGGFTGRGEEMRHRMKVSQRYVNGEASLIRRRVIIKMYVDRCLTSRCTDSSRTQEVKVGGTVSSPSSKFPTVGGRGIARASS